MKTRAAVLREVGAKRPYDISKPLKIEEVELDDPKQNEILVKVHAAGLCHSDLSVIDGNRPRPLPMALGHEAAGEVVEVGHGVADLEVGDHVVFSFVPSCGSCSYCLNGRAALCSPGAKANNEGVLIGGGVRLHKDKGDINHHLGVSGFAEYAVTSRRSAVKIPKDLPFEIAAVFGCAVLTGVGAIIHTAGLRTGQSLLVVGLGGVGLSAVLGAISGGARQIIAADISKDKLDLAKKLGATHVINSKDDDALEQVKAISDGGVDVAAEFAGVQSALEFAFAATGKGGRTVTAGLPHPSTKLEISPVKMVAEERSFLGSYLGGHVPALDIPEYIGLYQAGRLPVEKLLTHRLKLEEINEGFERLAKGDAIRQVVMFD